MTETILSNLLLHLIFTANGRKIIRRTYFLIKDPSIRFEKNLIDPFLFKQVQAIVSTFYTSTGRTSLHSEQRNLEINLRFNAKLLKIGIPLKFEIKKY